MQNATADDIKRLVTSTTLIRVTFRLEHSSSLPAHWTIRERPTRHAPTKPKLVFARKNIGTLSALLQGRGYRLASALASAQYETNEVLRKPRVTFFWNKGTVVKPNLMRTPDAQQQMIDLSRQSLYNVEVYIDPDQAVGFYCKPVFI